MENVGAGAFVIDLFEIRRDIGRAGAAVAGDNGGAALHEEIGVLPRLGLNDAAVAVRMQVDEARCDDHSFALDHFG